MNAPSISLSVAPAFVVQLFGGELPRILETSANLVVGCVSPEFNAGLPKSPAPTSSLGESPCAWPLTAAGGSTSSCFGLVLEALLIQVTQRLVHVSRRNGGPLRQRSGGVSNLRS